MPKAKKLLRGAAAACALVITAACGYGALVVYQARGPANFGEPPDPTSLHSALVQMVQAYKQDQQVLMPLAYGVGYQKELFDRALADSGSTFKISGRMDSCQPETVTAALISGHAKRFPMPGQTRDGRYFSEMGEPYTADPAVVASYSNVGRNEGMTVLMSSSPSWAWLRPQVLPPASALQDPTALRFGAGCQEPTELSTLAEQLRATPEYKVKAPDGKEWVLPRQSANEFRLEGEPRELLALAPLVHAQLSTVAKGAGGPIALQAQELGVENGASFTAQVLQSGSDTVMLRYRAQNGKAELSLYTSDKNAASERPTP